MPEFQLSLFATEFHADCVLPKFIVSSDVQPRKANEPIVSMLLGRETVFSPRHPANAYCPLFDYNGSHVFSVPGSAVAGCIIVVHCSGSGNGQPAVVIKPPVQVTAALAGG